jgi:glucose-1-phosphate thymidylyltransferase
MMAGIREILIISTPRDVPIDPGPLGGRKSIWNSAILSRTVPSEWNCRSILIGEKFISGSSVCLILGDNIFYGHNLNGLLQTTAQLKVGACVFGYHVHDPERYGVVGI